MHSGARAPVAIAFAIAVAGVLTACLPLGIACPTIGYISSVDVRVHGEFASLEACIDSGCASSLSDPTGAVTLHENAPGYWTVDFLSGLPDALTVRALDANGVLLREDDFELVWTPVGETGPCPGPVETPELAISVGTSEGNPLLHRLTPDALSTDT